MTIALIYNSSPDLNLSTEIAERLKSELGYA
jgi:hypothetical protein